MIKINNKQKAFALFLGLAALLLPTSAWAQAYDKEAAESYNGGAFYELIAYDTYLDELANVLKAVELNRGSASISGGSITNDDFGTSPLGSGLGILIAAGAGYVVVRRKRSRKNTTLLLACVLMLGFTQCKKEQIEPQGGKVSITLNVENGGASTGSATDGAKVNVNENHVTFGNGDKILVAYDGKYVGTIVHNGTNFTGNITITQNGTKPLYFYFLGNKDAGTLTAGTTTSCTVNISDQTGYPALPVISFSASNEDFTGEGTYTASLHNKASLMKFSVTTPSNSPICITGMNNKVIIDFSKAANDGANYGFTYDKEDGGIIKLKGGKGNNVEKWAIVLPQPELAAGSANSIYAQNGTYTTFTGSRPLIHAIEANGYYHEGSDVIAMTVNTATEYVDLGDITAHTTIATGKTIIGTLAVNKKISIATGATVTLNGVSINDNGGWTSGDYAGISCEGDATIILSGENILRGIDDDYPGIHIKENKTLTIRGTGSLDASGNPTGNCYSAGIGGDYNNKCGNIVIEGGTITATGGNQGGAAIGGAYCGGYGYITISGGTVMATAAGEGAGIGSGFSSGHASGNITISGGTVTATSQGNGAGIGSGYSGSGSVGNILISGGTITATGGNNAAGIGSGFSSSCGSITIENTVTSVTATKGSGAPNSIGAGNSGTCGTVTIGGVEGAISTSPYTYEPLPEGALSGKFTINASGDQVYFSQGNLKYSNGTWSFHTNQYDMCFTSTGNVGAYYTSSGTFDLFGWGTSGYDDKYPYLTSSDYGEYIHGEDIAGTEYDWGVHNTISNGGTGWRTLTRDEWDYLLYQRETTSDARYAKATVNDVAGLIILPDDWSTSYYDIEFNSPTKAFSFYEIELSDWTSIFEAHGAVFLPVFGFRDETTAIPYIDGVLSYYWSSTYYNYDPGPGSECSYYLTLGEYYDDYYQYGVNYVATNTYGPVFAGAFVRLVKDAN